MPVVREEGNTYGRLTVVRREENDRRGGARWRCLCECGGHIVTSGYSLRKGFTKSCGCLQKETGPKNGVCSRFTFVHGHNNRSSATYRTWHSMKQRCFNANRDNYRFYGGRGITVCGRWKSSFENFLADMGERPEGTTLDRINSNGDYEPSNCRWATDEQQAKNRRRRV